MVQDVIGNKVSTVVNIGRAKIRTCIPIAVCHLDIIIAESCEACIVNILILTHIPLRVLKELKTE